MSFSLRELYYVFEQTLRINRITFEEFYSLDPSVQIKTRITRYFYPDFKHLRVYQNVETNQLFQSRNVYNQSQA